MSILDDLERRGLVQDVSHRDELDALLKAETVTAYAGYDPTAPSLHVGNLVPTIMLARLQKAGHRPIALVGGATGMIGDPSGKSDERNLLGPDVLAENLASIRRQLEPFLDFDDSPRGAIMADNATWFRDIGFLDFLRDVGKYLTVNYMAAKDSVKNRLSERNSGISYTEFSYMLLQAYDFVHLAETYQCRLQVGGSDQWGNITAGIELQRKMGRASVYGLTAPLLLDASGQKMGKTSTGQRIWLDPEKTSPYSFYQYWLNTDDNDVGRLLRIFSWRPVDEVEEIAAAHAENPGARGAQRVLAEELTTWVHGAAATRSAVAASQVMFGGSLDDLSDADLQPLLADLPSTTIERSELAEGIKLIELLARTGLSKSRGAARKLAQGGGAYINNVRVSDANKVVDLSDLGTESMLILRAGKKSYHLIALASS